MQVRGFLVLVASVLASAVGAQSPRIAALYPAGAQAGQTVEVAVRGGGLAGAKQVFVSGAPGVQAQLLAGVATPNEAARPLFQNKCVTCHESRSPDNRTMSPEQWASTVDRMITVRSADINKADRDTIVGWLQARARAGQLTVKMTIAPDASPGPREVRLVTENGISTPWTFEVGGLAETLAQPNATQPLQLPVVINGALTQSGQRDRFTFTARKGERVTFNLKAFRINEQCPAFFNPALYLFNSQGKEVAKSLGRIEIDPVLDWTCDADGEYTILVRDLLWKGNPASVYRLAVGPLPLEQTLSTLAVKPGTTLPTTMGGFPVELRVPLDASGITLLSTDLGAAPALVRDLPDGGGPVSSVELATPVTLPAVFSGKLDSGEQVDRFKIQALRGGFGLELYARRLGSLLRAKVTIRNAKNEVVRTAVMESDDDLRLPGIFGSPGQYVVEVSANGETSGVYCWETTGAGIPDFSLSLTPDGANLAPGRSAALLVRATRREAISEPITLRITGLPKGIKATPAVIPPDDDKAVLVLTADDTVELGGSVVTVEGETTFTDRLGKEHTLKRLAQPIELYRTQNNNLRPILRSTAYLGLERTGPPFALTLEGLEEVKLAPGQSKQVRVKVLRPGGRTDVLVSALGLPPGFTISPGQVYVPFNSDEATFTIRATDAARYMGTRDRKLPPFQMVFVATVGGRNADAPTDCTMPLLITSPRTDGIRVGGK